MSNESLPARVKVTIPPEADNSWGICEGYYNASQSSFGFVESYIHETDPTCRIIRLFGTNVDYKWHLAKFIPHPDLPDWLRDPENQNSYLNIIQEVPLWYNVEAKGGEDIPCMGCAAGVRVESGEFTHRYNVKHTFEDPNYSVEFGGKRISGSSFVDTWTCNGPCEFQSYAQSCTWAPGDTYSEARGCDGPWDVVPLRTRLMGWVDSLNENSLNEIWELTHDTDISGAQDHSFLKSGCFFADGSYPNEAYPGDKIVTGNEYTNPGLKGEYYTAPNKYGRGNGRDVFWQFELTSSPEKKWSSVGSFLPSQYQAAQLIEAIEWTDTRTPEQIADGAPSNEPELRKSLGCMMFSVTSQWDVNLTVDATKTDSPPAAFPIATLEPEGELPSPPDLRLIGPSFVQV